ncbi:DNA -binding domain-containing protein [Sphingomonas fennica]|uniref:DNA -binding domain-containing protein n=1 Tax=Edaphosphingomonas fennica TaxID=114404 RepID=UPI001476091F|nr:DUF2285 domain-containing protein [Sphingomonas fennica]
MRIVDDEAGEHLWINRGGNLIRLDLIEGRVSAGPASLHFDLPDDCHLELRLTVIRSLVTARPAPGRNTRLAGRLRALQAADARAAGASLRDIADALFGPGHWPGDGEHRKSLVRRLVATGKQMVRSGPRAVLIEKSG